jgi:hypothetical protein
MKLTLLALALLASASVTLSYTPTANVNRKAGTKRTSSAIGAGGAGTYGRRRANPNTPAAAPTPHAPNANTSFIGGSTDGVGIRRRGNQNGANVQPHDPVNANANTSFIGGTNDGIGIRRKAPRKRRRH